MLNIFFAFYCFCALVISVTIGYILIEFLHFSDKFIVFFFWGVLIINMMLSQLRKKRLKLLIELYDLDKEILSYMKWLGLKTIKVRKIYGHKIINDRMYALLELGTYLIYMPTIHRKSKFDQSKWPVINQLNKINRIGLYIILGAIALLYGITLTTK